MPEFQGNYVAENALAYSIENNLKATRMAQSGSLAPSLMPVEEGFVNVVPFWGDLPGQFSDNTSGGALAFQKIGSASFVAPIVNVEKGWNQEGIVDAVTMGDRTVITQMVSRVSAFSQREVNRLALNVSLAATIGCDSGPGADNSAGEYQTVINKAEAGQALSHQDILDGCNLFQERQDEVSTIWMHSDVRGALDKQNLISNESAYPGQYIPFGVTTGGLAVMVDNSLEPAIIMGDEGREEIKVYPIILGAGDFAQYGDGSTARKFAHTYYDDVNDVDRLSTRQRHSYACFGASFVPVAQDRPATMEEVMDSGNWQNGFISENGEALEMGNYPFRSAVIIASLEDFEPEPTQ